MAVLFRVVFAALALSLVAGAVALVATGVWTAFQASGRSPNARVLDTLGFFVIAIAVFDVAKYLIEEEVMRDQNRRMVSEARRTLTRFISTIVIAICLEGIMLAFKVVRDDFTKMVFPVLLLLCGIAMLIGLGIFQRMSVSVEKRLASPDRSEE